MSVRLVLCLFLLFATLQPAAPAVASDAIQPKQKIILFNGTDLDGFTTWLRDTKTEDPRRVFRVTDGELHITGDGFGYLGTRERYGDYRLVAEYRWGKKTDGGKFVRNSGIMLHSVPEDGTYQGVWTSSIECQLAQGCVGDLIVIRGNDPSANPFPVSVAAEVEVAPDGKRHRWKEGGPPKMFPPTRGQLWWSRHDWDFQELIDTRGKDDVESPVGEWTRVECVCDGDRIEVTVNGHRVNRSERVNPAAGRILLQSEGFELFIRKLELHPLTPE